MRIYDDNQGNWVEFIRHIDCPDDQYTKELAIMRFPPDHDVLYTKRQGKDGSVYWSVASIGVTMNGKKEYFDTFEHDSKKKENAIKEFLQKRGWEKVKPATGEPLWNPNPYAQPTQQTSMSDLAQEQQLPF